MTRDKAIAELVRIWQSPHLDLSLKAGLAEAIEALKENNQSDSLVRDEVDACKESESKLDLISRQDAIVAVSEAVAYGEGFIDVLKAIEKLPSAEPKTGEWVLDGCTPICSACHEEPCWSSGGYDFTDFCPNCGAKMEGGEEE